MFPEHRIYAKSYRLSAMTSQASQFPLPPPTLEHEHAVSMLLLADGLRSAKKRTVDGEQVVSDLAPTAGGPGLACLALHCAGVSKATGPQVRTPTRSHREASSCSPGYGSRGCSPCTTPTAKCKASSPFVAPGMKRTPTTAGSPPCTPTSSRSPATEAVTPARASSSCDVSPVVSRAVSTPVVTVCRGSRATPEVSPSVSSSPTPSSSTALCWTLTLVWSKGTRLEIRELFWSLEDANAAARQFVQSVSSVVSVTVLRPGSDGVGSQVSVVLRNGNGSIGDVFVCVDTMMEDTIKVCPLPLIKDLMRKRRLSVSGSKKELIRRLLWTIGLHQTSAADGGTQ